jgi:hypothetical protein
VRFSSVPGHAPDWAPAPGERMGRRKRPA